MLLNEKKKKTSCPSRLYRSSNQFNKKWCKIFHLKFRQDLSNIPKSLKKNAEVNFRILKIQLSQEMPFYSVDFIYSYVCKLECFLLNNNSLLVPKLKLIKNLNSFYRFVDIKSPLQITFMVIL